MGNNIRLPMPMMNMSPGLRQHSTPPQPFRGGPGGPPPSAGGMNTPRGPYQQNMGGGKMGQQGNNQGRGTPYQRPPQGGGQGGYQPRPPHGNQRWN
ncbi:MAG: hypothetical protein GY696_15615 [Gammaproteobacteria bacterium]|nr:hypothetical protein [Gammaproteobacteria bacterium]